MNKLIILGLFAVTAACVGQNGVTQSGVDPSTPDPVEEAVENSEYVRVVLAGALVKANLPPHLQEQGDQVLANAEKRLDECTAQVRQNRLVWVYKVCTTTVLKTSRWQLKQLVKQAAAASTTVEPAVVA